MGYCSWKTSFGSFLQSFIHYCLRKEDPNNRGDPRETLCAGNGEILLGGDIAKQLSKVSLSNDTVHQRIINMSQDILTKVVNEIKQSPSKTSIQIDESTGVSNHSQLLVFVRYVHKKEHQRRVFSL